MGNDIECFYNLMLYGIARSAIPIRNNGEIMLEFHQSFINNIERQEAEAGTYRRQMMLCKFNQMKLILEPIPIPDPPNDSIRLCDERSSPTTASQKEGDEEPEGPEPQRASYDLGQLVPRTFDIILGRGRKNTRKGNQKLKQLQESYLEVYEAHDKFGKTVLAEVVVRKVISEGSRFLTRRGGKADGMWVEVSFQKARAKVSHDFRNLIQRRDNR